LKPNVRIHPHDKSHVVEAFGQIVRGVFSVFPYAARITRDFDAFSETLRTLRAKSTHRNQINTNGISQIRLYSLYTKPENPAHTIPARKLCEPLEFQLGSPKLWQNLAAIRSRTET
jgi:hypothetical protein